MSSGEHAIKPFLKWAGGKRWLTEKHSHLLPNIRRRYIEPFLGGGAVFFSLRPERAHLADTNSRLMACYSAIKADWRAVWGYLKEYERAHSDEYYYRAREYSHRSDFREAARFIYLNRACFNGIYRENLNGKFNVPRGSKDTIIFPDDDFAKVSLALQAATLKTADFSMSIGRADKDDFVFIDPPYTVRHNLNGFVKYNQKIFSWSDQVRLRADVEAAAQRGAKVLVTNANHASVRKLYAGMGRFSLLSRRSVIAGSVEARGNSTELAIAIGYDVDETAQSLSAVSVEARSRVTPN